MRFGWLEILIIVLLIVLLFGGSRLPQLARSFGQARKEFKESIKDEATPDKGDQKN